MNIRFWLGYTYRDIEWKWAFVRIKLLNLLSANCLTWARRFNESSDRILDAQDHRGRNEGESDAK